MLYSKRKSLLQFANFWYLFKEKHIFVNVEDDTPIIKIFQLFITIGLLLQASPKYP